MQKLFVTLTDSYSGTGLAPKPIMEFFCRHCDAIIVGTPYRVISEENGVVLLNMTVCHACHEQAKALGLEAAPLHPDNRTGGATWPFCLAEA